MTLPTIPVEASPLDQALYAFLVEKGNRSGSKRTVESYSRMLWRFFAETTPDRVNPPMSSRTPTASASRADRRQR